MRWWAVTGSVAGATGPVVGGPLTQVDWRLVFLINLPIGVFALITAALAIPAPERDHDSVLPHLVEVGAIVVGLGALALSIVKGPDWRWPNWSAACSPPTTPWNSSRRSRPTLSPATEARCSPASPMTLR